MPNAIQTKEVKSKDGSLEHFEALASNSLSSKMSSESAQLLRDNVKMRTELSIIFRLTNHAVRDLTSSGNIDESGNIKQAFTPLSYIRMITYDYDRVESPKASEPSAVNIIARNMFMEGMVTVEDGIRLLDVLSACLKSNTPVNLDLTGVIRYGADCFDVGFGNLFEEFDRKTIDTMIHMEGVPPKVGWMISTVKNASEKYHTDPEFRAKVDSGEAYQNHAQYPLL